MRRLIIGDIHGEFERMIDVLEKCGFDPNQNVLYSTGDLCDRGPEPVAVLDYLYALPHFYPVVGNHDLWILGYLQQRLALDDYWLWVNCNHGDVTRKAVDSQPEEWKRNIADRISATPVVRKAGDFLICHGGFYDRVIKNVEPEKFLNIPVRDLDDDTYDILYEDVIWDRSLLYRAMSTNKSEKVYDCRVIVGHTPLKAPFVTEDGNLIAIDTGAFVPAGKITVMDLDTGEFWHSTAPTATIL